MLDIRFSHPSFTRASLIITGITGKAVYAKELSEQEISSGMVSVAVQAFAHGQYILKLSSAKGAPILSTKFIKQ